MRIPRSGIRETIGLGYVIIPSDKSGKERDRFVKNCLRKEKISILLERSGGIANDCPITKEALKSIIFPDEFGKTGSQVVYFRDPYSNLVIVFGVISKEDQSDLGVENIKNFKSIVNNNAAIVSVDGNKGNINLTVDSTESDGGQINISITNNDLNGKLNVVVNGESTITTSKKCTIKSNEEIDLQKISSSGSLLGEIKISDKLTIKNTSYDLKVILNDLMTAIKQITVPTPSGTSGTPINFAAFDEINTQINNLLES